MKKLFKSEAIGLAIVAMVVAVLIGRAITMWTHSRVVEPPKEQSEAEKWVNPVSKTRDRSHYDPDILQTATLSSMRPKLDTVGFGSSLEEINRARIKLQCVNDWVTALPEGEVKDAYMAWINYFLNDYNKYEADLTKPKPRVDEYEERHKEELRKAAALDIPRVPSQVCTPKEKGQ